MAKLQNPNPSFQKPKTHKLQVLLKLLSSMILWNEGQNQEFERRNWKESKVFGYGDEEEEEILERESEIRFGEEKRGNPYINAAKRLPNQNKTRGKKFWEKNKSARADCEIRPGAWFPRATFSDSQKSIRTPGRILGRAAVGLSFEGLPDSESSEI